MRTPLNPVLLVTTDLLDDSTTPAVVRPALEMTRRNLELEARLIDDLLDVSRILRGKMSLQLAAVDAHALIHRTLEICRSDLHAGEIRLTLDLRATDHHIHADSARLQQVLWNLIKNAVKFTPPRGTVAIRSSNEAHSDRPHLLMAVEDTGVGIEPHLLPRIFDPFEQGDASAWTRKSAGLGLGLSIGQSVAKAHGGCLTASSAGRGQGAKFTLELPTIPAPASDLPGQPSPCEAARETRPLKILLVEDDPASLTVMARLLHKHGHTILTAGNLAAALEVASAEEFDLIISDLGLPDGNGLELMRRLRARRAVAGIALTGFGTDEDIRRSREAGFAGHLTKPVDLRRLEAMIRHVIL